MVELREMSWSELEDATAEAFVALEKGYSRQWMSLLRALLTEQIRRQREGSGDAGQVVH